MLWCKVSEERLTQLGRAVVGAFRFPGNKAMGAGGWGQGALPLCWPLVFVSILGLPDWVAETSFPSPTLEARGLKSRVSRALLPPKAPGGGGEPLPASSSSPGFLLTLGVPWLTAVSLQFLRPLSHGLLPICRRLF